MKSDSHDPQLTVVQCKVLGPCNNILQKFKTCEAEGFRLQVGLKY